MPRLTAWGGAAAAAGAGELPNREAPVVVAAKLTSEKRYERQFNHKGAAIFHHIFVFH